MINILQNCLYLNATGTVPHLSDVNIASGNGLVPLGNKSLPQSMLIYIYVAILCRHNVLADLISP